MPGLYSFIVPQPTENRSRGPWLRRVGEPLAPAEGAALLDIASHPTMGLLGGVRP
jgi:hypothetical protein